MNRFPPPLPRPTLSAAALRRLTVAALLVVPITACQPADDDTTATSNDDTTTAGTDDTTTAGTDDTTTAAGTDDTTTASNGDTGAPLEQTPSTDQASEVTIEDLAGLYVLTDGNGWMWEFHADGTGGWQNLWRGEYEEQEFVIDGGVLKSRLDCAWHVTLAADGTLTGVIAEPEGTRRDCPWPAGEVWEWIRISPPPEPGTVSRFENLTASDPRSLSAENLPGLWWKENGQVLLIDETKDGLAYRLDDDGDLLTAPDDSGFVVLDDLTRGDLKLQSDTDCQRRDPGTMTDVSLTADHQRSWPTTVRVMTAESTPGECPAHDDLGGVWIQVH